MDNFDKVLLYYNPKAGNGVISARLDRIVERFQRKRLQLIPVRADKRDFLDKFFQSVDGNSYRKILAAGGDGTINTMVNAMVKHDIHTPLGILPAGTANDLAWYFDIPQSIDDALDIILSDRYTEMDVGLANGKAFANVLAMGMVVDVSQKTDPNVKNTLGVMAYYLRSMAEIPKLRPIPIKVTSDGMDIETDMYAMLVMNGKSAGGFKSISPESEINDGLFDVYIFESANITNWGPLFISLLTGNHADNKSVVYFRASKLKIESETVISADVDGETAESPPLDISLLPKRLRICTLTNNMSGNIW